MQSRKRDEVIIVGASYGTGNMGVDALLSGTIASILEAKIDTRITLLDFNYESKTFDIESNSTNIKLRLENLRFSWKFWLRNNGFRLLLLAWTLRAIPLNFYRKWCMATHPPLDTINRASMVVSLAGGDSFSDIYGFRRLVYVSLPQLLAIAMRKPLLLLPQTIGPFKAWWARMFGQFIINHSEKTFARDQVSLGLGKKLTNQKEGIMKFSHDMAFALEPKTPAGTPPIWLREKKRPLIGLNISGLLYSGGYTGQNMFGLGLDYADLMQRIIEWFTGSMKCNVVLISHVAGYESDHEACIAIRDKVQANVNGLLHVANPNYDHREIKHIIGKCDFFLGSRMHACIAALSQCVPAVGLAYSRKFAGVFESIDVPELVVDLRNSDSPETLKQVGHLYGKRELLVQKLEQSGIEARESARNLFCTIDDFKRF